MPSTWYFSCRDLKRLACLKRSRVVSTPWMFWPSQIAPLRKTSFLVIFYGKSLYSWSKLIILPAIKQSHISQLPTNKPICHSYKDSRYFTISFSCSNTFPSFPSHLAHIRYKSSVLILIVKVEITDLVKVKASRVSRIRRSGLRISTHQGFSRPRQGSMTSK